MPRSETIHELVEHEVAFHQRLVVLVDLPRQAVEEFRLHLAQGLGRHAAALRQVRIGLFPLAQFVGPLPLRRADLADQLLQDLVLAILARQDLPQQVSQLPVRHAARRGRVEWGCGTSIWL